MSRRINDLTRCTDEERLEMTADFSHEEQAMLEKNLSSYANANNECSSKLEVRGGHPDYEYMWIATHVNNEEIPGKISHAAREFWQAVNESELPEMASFNHAFRGSRSSFIEYGNLVLHKRHNRFREIYNAKARAAAQKVRSSISVASGFNANTPGTVDRRSLRFDAETVEISR